jgi:putative transposase
MPRANRYFLPGYVWHITHRCHKREFLLKFAKDKKRWLGWLFEAKKRYGLIILNYMVTSNHIHLLVRSNGNHDCIPKSIQLIAGRTGQEYNQRKRRKGAFWEDRYHATAVAKADYLAQCMDYIDLNMVRAGVVSHPEEWPFCGYFELMSLKTRFRLLDHKNLTAVLALSTTKEVLASRKRAIESVLQTEKIQKNKKWTESIAIGSEHFVETVRDHLGQRARSRNIHHDEKTYQLRESVNSYSSVFDGKKTAVSDNNSLLWDHFP